MHHLAGVMVACLMWQVELKGLVQLLAETCKHKQRVGGFRSSSTWLEVAGCHVSAALTCMLKVSMLMLLISVSDPWAAFSQASIVRAGIL
jgi:hypothetical protein